MRATGIIRSFDDLGRIVIPRTIREDAFGTYKTEGKVFFNMWNEYSSETFWILNSLVNDDRQ